MAIIKCPECGHEVSDQARTCPHCGIDIAGKITRCPDCGEAIFKEQERCPNCHCTINASAPVVGSQQPSHSSVPSGVEETVTATGVQDKNNAQRPAPKARKRSWIALLVAFVIALIVVLLGIYFYQRTQAENEMRAYENAMRSSEPAVLQNFLDMYVDAPREHRDSIGAHLEALKKIDTDWTNAAVSASKSELEKYMKMHPQSIHCVEARIMIDSLDWLTALAADTPEAYNVYMAAHADGAHYDEAHDRHERLEAQKVNANDKRMVSELFTTYYKALASGDEAMLTTTLAPVLTSFLHKEQATKTDVVTYMYKIHEPDIQQITYSLNNDWKIEKQPADDNLFSYSVDFSVDQRIERSDESKERFCTYKVMAKITTDCKICELNMKKVVQ